MAKIKPGLGKGLDLLIPADDEITEEKNEQVFLKLAQIEPNRFQPRMGFNEESLNELAESVKAHGVIQPVIVRKRDDHYELIAGERRWRAARLAGLKEIPVVIKEYSDEEISEIALIENIQREDLTPIEEAKAYRALIKEYGITQEELSGRIAKSRTKIANTMRLLNLDEEVQAMVEAGTISAGHARALLALKDKKAQAAAAERICENNLSVRETEALVKKLNTPPKKDKKTLPENDIFYRDFERQMAQSLGTKVKIANNADGTGKITIDYFSDGELERLLAIIKRGSKES